MITKTKMKMGLIMPFIIIFGCISSIGAIHHNGDFGSRTGLLATYIDSVQKTNTFRTFEKEKDNKYVLTRPGMIFRTRVLSLPSTHLHFTQDIYVFTHFEDAKFHSQSRFVK